MRPRLTTGVLFTDRWLDDSAVIDRGKAELESANQVRIARHSPRQRWAEGRAESPARVAFRAQWWSSCQPLIRLKILKIGMYNATIIEPMMPPNSAIISGSISAVNDSVVDSTSWS